MLYSAGIEKLVAATPTRLTQARNLGMKLLVIAPHSNGLD